MVDNNRDLQSRRGSMSGKRKNQLDRGKNQSRNQAKPDSSKPPSPPQKPVYPEPPQVRSLNLFTAPFSKPEWGFLAFICLAAIITRFVSLTDHGFWIDEIMTLQDANAIINPTFYKRVHWLSFLLVRLSMEIFGVSEFSLRLPSALAGVLTIPVIYLLARQWLGIPAAVAASILVLLSPYQIHFSQEARYYTEITLAASVMLLCAVRFVHYEQVYLIFIFVLSAVALFGIHASTGVFIIAVFIMMLALMIWHGRHRVLMHHVRYSWKYRIAVIISLVCLTVAVMFMWRYLSSYMIKALGNLLNVSELKRTKGVSFSFSFFASTWKRFPAIYGPSLVPGAWMIYFIIMIIGQIYCVRIGKAWISIFYWLCYVLTCAALFLIPLPIPFTEKYLIFLYPLYIVSVAAGVCQIAQWLLLLKPAAVSRENRLFISTAALTLILAGIFLPDSYRALTMEIDPSKKTVAFFQENAQPGDVFLTSGFDLQFIHYASDFGFSKDDFIRYTPDNEENLSSTINKYLTQNRNIWFVLWKPVGSVLDIDKTRSLLSEIFEAQTSYESYMAREWNQEIFKLKPSIPNIGSTSLIIKLDDGTSSPFEVENYTIRRFSLDPSFTQSPDKNRRNVSIPLRAMVPRDYVFSLWFKHPNLIEDVLIKCNDNQIPIERSDQIPELHWISHEVSLSPAMHNLEIEIISSSDTLDNSDMEGVIIVTNGSPIDRLRRPNTFHKKSHFLTPIDKAIEDVKYTQFSRSGYVDYSFTLFSKGDYTLTVRALNDIPSPVLLQVDINGKFHCFLSFNHDDNSFSDKYIHLENLDLGELNVSLHFLNSIHGTSEDDTNRVFGLEYIRLTKSDPDQVPQSQPTRVALIDESLRDQYTGLVAYNNNKSIWTALENTVLSVVDRSAVQIRVDPSETELVGVMTEAIEFTEKSGGVYISGELNINNMNNHTVNVLFLALNENGDQIVQQYFFPTGYMQTEGWEKFAAYLGCPKDINGVVIKYAAIGIVAYPNSSMPGDSEEIFSIRNVSLTPR